MIRKKKDKTMNYLGTYQKCRNNLCQFNSTYHQIPVNNAGMIQINLNKNEAGVFLQIPIYTIPGTLSQKISYGNVNWGVANLNGVFAAITNLISYTGLNMNSDILSQSSKLGIRFLENVAPSTVGIGITGYLASLPKPNLNEFRDEERIKSQRGRFIWEYLL